MPIRTEKRHTLLLLLALLVGCGQVLESTGEPTPSPGQGTGGVPHQTGLGGSASSTEKPNDGNVEAGAKGEAVGGGDVGGEAAGGVPGELSAGGEGGAATVDPCDSDPGACGVNECAGVNVCTAAYPCQDLRFYYTCRGQFADWTPSDSPTTLTDNLDGTVSDSRTGLSWQQSLDASSYTWAGAKAYCSELSLTGSGWRLPTQAELQSIVDYARHTPAIDAALFPGTPDGSEPIGTLASWFWSSSPADAQPDYAWLVAFDDGYAFTNLIDDDLRVRCVRSSAAVTASAGAGGAPPGRYTFNQAGTTAHDTRTRLTWQRTVDDETFTLAEAVSHCATLPLDGGGWRVPQISELFTIVDPTQYEPALDPTAFLSTPYGNYWSSSPYLPLAGYAWVVNFSVGYYTSPLEVVVKNPSRVRCVR